MLRPLLKWVGGKSQLSQSITELFPAKYDRYVEPFVGGGAIFLSLPAEIDVLICDTNPDLINLYSVVRSHPAELMKTLDRMAREYSEKFYYEVRASRPTKPVDRAARMVFLNKTGFNGLYRENSRGEFNVAFGKRKNCPELYNENNLVSVSERLKNVKIKCQSFMETMSSTRKNDMIYCDPPYVPVSTTANFSSYTGAGFQLPEHLKLQTVAIKAAAKGCHILISNSSSAINLGLYKGWKIRTVLANRAINCNGQKRGAVEEVLAYLDPDRARRLVGKTSHNIEPSLPLDRAA